MWRPCWPCSPVLGGVVFGALIAVMFIGINVSTLSRAKRVDLGTELQEAHRLLLAHRPADAERVAHGRAGQATVGRRVALGERAARLESAVAGRPAPVRSRPCSATATPANRARRSAPRQALAAGRINEGVTLLAWALVNEPAGPAKSLAAVAAAGSGQSMAVANELRCSARRAHRACGCSHSCSATPATTPTPRPSAASLGPQQSPDWN